MANLYWYYNEKDGTKTGPVQAVQLKQLADNGVIQPDTVIESENGQKVYAKNIQGLFNVREPATKKMEIPLPPAPPLSSKIIQPENDNLFDENTVQIYWFYYDAANRKVGPFTWETIQMLAHKGIIQPETIIESDDTSPRLARSFTGKEGLIFPTAISVVQPVQTDSTTSNIEAASQQQQQQPQVIYVERQQVQQPQTMSCGCAGCLIVIIFCFIFMFLGIIAASFG